MADVTKNSKQTSKSTSPEQLDAIGYKLDLNISGTLVFKIIKIKKKQQNKVTVTYFVFISPILLICNHLERT